MSEEQKKTTNDNNVVLFPGLVEKLVAKGMDSLKEKSFQQALSYFEQSLEIDPDHPQGRFGVALSFIELGMLKEATNVTEEMLKEDIGNYYDILQVHISLLVQLGNYQEVVTMLEGIIQEEKLPAKMAESLYHLLHFSRQMVEDVGTDVSVEQDILTEDSFLLLSSEVTEKQWIAIQTLRKNFNDKVLEAFQRFLVAEENDPVLKSIVLQILKEEKINKKVKIHKFGKTFMVDIEHLEDVFHEKIGTDTLKNVSSVLEQNDPSLYEIVSHIWWHYLFAIYPNIPEPRDSQLWAASIHQAGLIVFGIEQDEKEVANFYDVDATQIGMLTKEILNIQMETFQVT